MNISIPNLFVGGEYLIKVKGIRKPIVAMFETSALDDEAIFSYHDQSDGPGGTWVQVPFSEVQRIELNISKT